MSSDFLDEDEHALRTAALSGDETAWRVLYERHFNALFAHVHRETMCDLHRTQEIVQDCWLVAVKKMRAFDPAKGNFGVWLCGIADRLLANDRRRWARRNRLNHEIAAGTAIAPPAMGEGERFALVLGSLPDRYQIVLRAKYEQEQSVAEIARTWGQNVKTVESLLTRARAAFRQAFAQLEQEHTKS
ncbi:MAG: sigma-70 family RNA polymerase sigma factor [Candidatus Hydrogenedentes bacterium]|nr:sigma-70 family RNA polymerase sigma factor [Candidatus Hydrogenedentota bacterium]